MQAWGWVCWLGREDSLTSPPSTPPYTPTNWLDLEIDISCFWSIWNSYPSCWRLFYGKVNVFPILVFDSLWFQDSITSNYKISKNLKFQKFKKWTHACSKTFEILDSQISIDNIFQYDPRKFPDFLDLFEVFSFNKMKEYGVPGPPKPRNHQILSFWCLMPWNRDLISLAWSRKIILRHSIYFLDNTMPCLAQKCP